LGVSHQLTKDSKEWAHRRGTMHYMAPEVAGLQKDEKYEALKADIYSLGVWLYILLIGEFPDLKVISQIFLATNDTEMDDNDTKKSDVDQTLVRHKELCEMLGLKDEIEKPIESSEKQTDLYSQFEAININDFKD
jgi:serine/threonine protein kinase